MYASSTEGRAITLGSKGFLASFDAWDDEVAEILAQDDGLELKDCHWKAIRFIREFYQKFEVPPSSRVLLRQVGDDLLDGLPCTYRTLKELFPKGGCKQACRLAGLPDYYCSSC